MHLFYEDFYLDEIKEITTIFDPFYGDVISPFFQYDLLDLLEHDGKYFQIALPEETPYVTFHFNDVYYKIPYHQDFTFDIYFNMFSLIYVLALPKDTNMDEHILLLKNLFDIVSTTPYKLSHDEISYGTLFELIECKDYFQEEYCFNVLNSTG